MVGNEFQLRSEIFRLEKQVEQLTKALEDARLSEMVRLRDEVWMIMEELDEKGNDHLIQGYELVESFLNNEIRLYEQKKERDA